MSLTKCLMNQGRTKGEGWSTAYYLKPPSPSPSNFIDGRPKVALLFGSLVILDVVCRYLSFFLSYINIKKVKIDVYC